MAALWQRVQLDWRRASLRTKILTPIVALMVLALLASTIAVKVGSDATHRRYLQEAATRELALLDQALDLREQAVAQSATMLASDPLMQSALAKESEEGLFTVNDRAVVLRDRMGLDLVQIYDRYDIARANLLLASVYTQSSLLDRTEEEGLYLIASGENLLLVARANLPNKRGAVITGIDLAAELERQTTLHGFTSLISLRTADALVCTSVPESCDISHFGHQIAQEILLADQPVTMGLTQHTDEVDSVTTAGLRIMVAVMLVTTTLLLGVGVWITTTITGPIRGLADAAQTVADGEWNAVGALVEHEPDDKNTENELTLLAHAFERMLFDLQDLYRGLEDKVDERTAELAATQERYRQFFNENLAGVFEADIQGRVLTCNPAFASIFQFESSNSARGHNLNEMFADRQELQAMLTELEANDRIAYRESSLLSQSGDDVHVIWNLSAERDADSRLTAIKGFIFDNSARVRLEEQLRQSQKMEAVGRLAGGVAHDFNNLLTVIIGYCELLLTCVTPAQEGDIMESAYCEPSAMKEDLDMIHTAARKAATLTRQLLAFSRKQVLKPQILDLNETVTDMGKMLQRLIGEDVSLDIHAVEGLPNINVDPGQLEQVIMNLVINAREAMPSGGSLLIETAQAYLGKAYAQRSPEVAPGRYAVLAVSDTGVGMDRETLDRIFEPFYTTKDSGTGLGLATVYGIIKQSAGHVTVYSEPGQGTTFKIYLPGFDAENSRDGEIASEQLYAGPLSVLLVEDELMVQQMAQRTLESQGYKVTCANNGLQALGILQQRDDFDLVISDVIMPEMSGGEMYDEIKELCPELQVMFMSGYTDTSVTLHGVTTSELPFIQKPFSPQALVQKVSEVIRQRPDTTTTKPIRNMVAH